LQGSTDSGEIDGVRGWAKGIASVNFEHDFDGITLYPEVGHRRQVDEERALVTSGRSRQHLAHRRKLAGLWLGCPLRPREHE
jgi:hypothetical protein